MSLITRMNILCLCLFLVRTNDISFKKITIYWELSNGTSGRKYVSSSNNLKENLPNTSLEVRVDINGQIPVLYENSVSDINNLEWLKIYYDNIEDIKPGAFKNVQVKSLWLSHNNITNLSKGIFKNVKLEKLYLGSNCISKIEAGVFSEVSNLKYLDLKQNNLKTLPEGELQNLPKLEQLFLSENKITKIEESTFQNSMIKELNLEKNEILSIDTKSFDNMTRLERIYLNDNKLTEWDKNWFYNTPSLRCVFFGQNRIKEIPDKAFQYLDEVEELDLGWNEISRFSLNAFVKNEENSKVKIDTLCLSKNNLTCIDGPLEDVFGSVGVVGLMSNPWDNMCKNKAEIYFSD